MGDEDVGEAVLALERGHELHDLRAHAHVERAHRLVGEDDARLEGDGPGDAHALPLPPRELARVPPGVGAIEPDLLALGVDPRSMLGIAFRKQSEIDEAIQKEFPLWPKDPPVRRVFEGVCEVLFPSEGPGVAVPMATRVQHAWQVVARARPSVVTEWGGRAERKPTAHAAE